MMTHILLDLPEEYQTIVKILEDDLYNEDYPITIERICDKLLVKFDGTNKQPRPRTSREDEKALYVKSQYKGTCTTCGKYRHKGKDCWQKEGANLQNFITTTNPGTPRKTAGRESGKKNQITTRTKITIRNTIIAK